MQILIVDFGSQYTLVLARRIRELGVQVKVLPSEEVDDWLREIRCRPNGVILSGGDKSVHDPDAPVLPCTIVEMGIPILGICYGMQLFAHLLDGEVKSGIAPKFGPQEIMVLGGSLLNGIKNNKVWASHGDIVTKTPLHFAVDSTYADGTIASMSNCDRKIYCVQFHPEVTHTISGLDMIKNFIFNICGCVEDWNPLDTIKNIQDQVRDMVGDRKAVLAFSGGVDSTTLARTLNFLGDNLLAVCIDTGGLRKGEIDWIKKAAQDAGVNLKVVDASEMFISLLAPDLDAEGKRSLFKPAYRLCLEGEAEAFGGKDCVIIQGTISPDVIESGAVGKASVIKSHHNVDQPWNYISIAPLSNLFKFEVRALARFFKLNEIAKQMPFPGPGLFIRIVGGPPTKERLALVRWADNIVTQVLKEGGVYNYISQLVVGLIVVNTVGIKGDHRAYGPAILIRAVETVDFMTANAYHIARDLRDKITSILCQHPEICRVWYDETPKPPGTIELQ